MTGVVRLWYVLLGDNGPTPPRSIEIGLDELVCDLQKIITTKNCIHDVELEYIVLYKSNQPIPITPENHLSGRIKNKGDIDTLAVEVEESSDSFK